MNKLKTLTALFMALSLSGGAWADTGILGEIAKKIAMKQNAGLYTSPSFDLGSTIIWNLDSTGGCHTKFFTVDVNPVTLDFTTFTIENSIGSRSCRWEVTGFNDAGRPEMELVFLQYIRDPQGVFTPSGGCETICYISGIVKGTIVEKGVIDYNEYFTIQDIGLTTLLPASVDLTVPFVDTAIKFDAQDAKDWLSEAGVNLDN